jgi:hypothetical protein
VDDWQNFTDIKWRAAFQLTPNGGKQIVGAASFEATTEVNTDNHTVLLFNINVTNTYFPGQDPAVTPQFDQLFRSLVPLTLTASLVAGPASGVHAQAAIREDCCVEE